MMFRESVKNGLKGGEKVDPSLSDKPDRQPSTLLYLSIPKIHTVRCSKPSQVALDIVFHYQLFDASNSALLQMNSYRYRSRDAIGYRGFNRPYETVLWEGTCFSVDRVCGKGDSKMVNDEIRTAARVSAEKIKKDLSLGAREP